MKPMKMKWMMLAACLTSVTCGAQEEKESKKSDPFLPRVKVETTLGDFVLELDAHNAPLTVLNFVRYVEDGYYEGTIFHRVAKDFLVQGGYFFPEMVPKTEGLRSTIRNEWPNGLTNAKGTVTMARRMRQPHSARAQFFINLSDNLSLDRPIGGSGYCVFGKVVGGEDTVEKIANTEVDTHPDHRRGKAAVVPKEPVVIKSMKLISEFDRSKSEAAVKMLQDIYARAMADKAKKKEEFVAWLAELKTKATETPSGLMYHDKTPGEGPSPERSNMVRVHYTAWLDDGTVLEDTREKGESEELWVDRKVPGWTEGVTTMKVGGHRILIVPPELGFGEQATRKVPPNSTLVYDIELYEIMQ